MRFFPYFLALALLPVSGMPTIPNNCYLRRTS